MKLYPFIYRVCRKDPNCNREAEEGTHDGLPAGVEPKHGKDRFIVYISSIVYTYQDMRWANDPRIGDRPLVPSLDLADEDYEFDNEEDAFNFVKSWWSKQN